MCGHAPPQAYAGFDWSAVGHFPATVALLKHRPIKSGVDCVGLAALIDLLDLLDAPQ
jgi:hypothetical protein